jgi:hypothetical protein
MEAPVVSPTAFPVLSCKGPAISRACSFLLRTWMVLPKLPSKIQQSKPCRKNKYKMNTFEVNTAASEAKTKEVSTMKIREKTR